MSAPERENFDVLLEYHEELRNHVVGLQEAMAAVALDRAGAVEPPGAAFKAKVLASAAAARAARTEPEGLVVTNSRGLIQWVNPAFTAMCGFSLEELKGRKPGEVLQGAATDPNSVERIRDALRTRSGCRETLVNYHKDGTPYLAEIRIDPILNDEREPLWFVARERKLADATLLAV